MQRENGERWRTLCQQVMTEQDPDKLIELATEITRLLDEKEERLKLVAAKPDTLRIRLVQKIL